MIRCLSECRHSVCVCAHHMTVWSIVDRTSFQPPKPQPVPSTIVSNVWCVIFTTIIMCNTHMRAHMQTDSMPVKLNTAAILREGARIQKVEEEEMKKYNKHNNTLYSIFTSVCHQQIGQFGSWWKGWQWVCEMARRNETGWLLISLLHFMHMLFIIIV